MSFLESEPKRGVGEHMNYLKVCSEEACDGVRETERGREKENKDTVLDVVLGNV